MLSPIRDDLDLHSASPTAGGHPTWVIHDPVRNKFFQIEWRVFEVLRRWKLGTAKHIARAVNQQTTLELTEQFVEKVSSFLSSHQLLRVENDRGTKALTEIKKSTQRSWWTWLLHHYLFFRIPLFRPDKFLTWALPYVRILYSKPALFLVLFSLVSGLILLARQWDVFFAQLIDFFSVRGLVFFVIALVIAKIAHEFGHAFTAKMYGCRIPAMGIAFLVMWPMLYTDTNESWKLGSRRQRLNVAAAGVIVELAIAAIATFAWNFLPSGGLRDMAFVMATTTWISSLAINISPFMRFDGYYLLSDWWGIPNLHERSFRLARWWLREKLFGLNEPAPEPFRRRRVALLILFAFCVWVYRFILFLGIAILVYNFFTKVLGIFLFLTEISWFILRPLWIELAEWRVRRKTILARKRVWISLVLLVCATLVLFIPWRASITTNAVFEAEAYSVVYLNAGGQLDSLLVVSGQEVERGELLARLKNPDLSFRLQQIDNQIAVQRELRKSAALDLVFRQQNAVIAAELVRLETERAALQERFNDLNVHAPIGGKITEVTPELSPGQWVGVGQRLLAIKGKKGIKITAYVKEEDVFRVHETGFCRFYLPVTLEGPFACRVLDVGRSAEQVLKDEMLASAYNGDIPASFVENTLVPDHAIYKISAIVDKQLPQINRQTLGMLQVDADRKSVIERFWRWSVAVLVRESGM